MDNKEAISILKLHLAENPKYYADKSLNEAFYMAVEALEEQENKPKTSSLYLTKEMKDSLFNTLRAYNMTSSDCCRLIGCGYKDWKLAVDGERPFYKGWVRKIKKHLNIEYDIFGGE